MRCFIFLTKKMFVWPSYNGSTTQTHIVHNMYYFVIMKWRFKFWYFWIFNHSKL